MSLGLRLLLPDRVQLRWDMTDLDSQLPPDHRARLVWAFVATLDLSAFHARIMLSLVTVLAPFSATTPLASPVIVSLP